MCKTLIITLIYYNSDSTVDPKTSVIMKLQCTYLVILTHSHRINKKFPVTDEEIPYSRKADIKKHLMLMIFGWECPTVWYHITRYIELFVMDAFIDMFITLCIVVNTLFMAMDHAGMSEQLTRTLVIGNYVSFCSMDHYLLL